MRSDEQKIHEVHSTWIEAVNAGDLVRLLTLMADDGPADFGQHPLDGVQTADNPTVGPRLGGPTGLGDEDSRF